MSDFRELKVWQKAHELALDVYRVTTEFPRHEIYGLVSQMRRCAVSVGSNIAEGKGRRGDVEFGRYIQFASGSLERTRISDAFVSRSQLLTGV